MLLITITNYNKGVYLMQLLDSLYKQIDENVKVLFIDDCSKDDSIEVIKNHPISSLENFELIENKKNMWVSYCRNCGINNLKRGDWITFIDSDDFVLDDYIKTLKSYMKNNKYDVYVYDYKVSPVVDIKEEDILKADNIMCWSRLYRGKFLLDNNIKFKDKYKKLGFGEDYDFNEQILFNEPRIKITKDIIYGYHWGVKDSLSNTHKKAELIICFFSPLINFFFIQSLASNCCLINNFFKLLYSFKSHINIFTMVYTKFIKVCYNIGISFIGFIHLI